MLAGWLEVLVATNVCSHSCIQYVLQSLHLSKHALHAQTVAVWLCTLVATCATTGCAGGGLCSDSGNDYCRHCLRRQWQRWQQILAAMAGLTAACAIGVRSCKGCNSMCRLFPPWFCGTYRLVTWSPSGSDRNTLINFGSVYLRGICWFACLIPLSCHQLNRLPSPSCSDQAQL